jgi:hypothetical protein
VGSLTIEADFWDYGHDIESMAIWKKINEGSVIKKDRLCTEGSHHERRALRRCAAWKN